MTENSKLVSIKGFNVFVTTFMPLTPPVAIVQINHGLAEHSERYFDFARHLCNKGYGIYLHDHPAHGKTADSFENTGHLKWHNGWDDMLDVIHGINKNIRKTHPSVPVFLMGHSMGSIMARYYNATFPMYFKGMIVSGTSNPDTARLKSSLFLVKAFKVFKKDTHKNPWLNDFFYKTFNKALKNTTTRFDWLTSNNEEVEKYINDPLCGFSLSLGFYKNLLQGTLQMLKCEKQLRFRKNFNTLIISGKQDPVGNFGKDPSVLCQKYLDQGFFNTQIKLLEGRHELLNEKEPVKMQTYEIILNWMDEKLKKG